MCLDGWAVRTGLHGTAPSQPSSIPDVPTVITDQSTTTIVPTSNSYLCHTLMGVMFSTVLVFSAEQLKK